MIQSSVFFMLALISSSFDCPKLISDLKLLRDVEMDEELLDRDWDSVLRTEISDERESIVDL